jgi:hypothetical protein
MRIGVVCEGPTDFVALNSFLTRSLQNRGKNVTLVDVQPELDASSVSSGGGWPNALLWILRNPLPARKTSYLGVGLFGENLSAKKCDLLLIFLDSDVLDDRSFADYVRRHVSCSVNNPIDPDKRFEEVQSILLSFCGFGSVLEAIDAKHLLGAAVESSEAWCVAVRDPKVSNVETLNKDRILAEFITRLCEFDSGSPRPEHAKRVTRRKSYCDHHVSEVDRLESNCASYMRIVGMFL